MKSEQVEGRIIHLAFDVTLYPQNTPPGKTDAAMDTEWG